MSAFTNDQIAIECDIVQSETITFQFILVHFFEFQLLQPSNILDFLDVNFKLLPHVERLIMQFD